MTALIGWEEKTAPTVKVGDEVCFARHVKLRDEEAARKLTASWEEFGKPVMLMLYGRIAEEPECINAGHVPSVWRVKVEVWQSHTFQPQGFSTGLQFGDWDTDGRTEDGPVIDFEFTFNEPLTVVRHDSSPV